MAETLGSLTDKLAIANLRLWHLEEFRRDTEQSDAERLRFADMIADVNNQRNALIDEIDQFLADALRDPDKRLVFKKNKLY